MTNKQLFIEIMETFQRGCNCDDTEFAKFKDVFTIDWECNITSRHYSLIIKLIENLFDIRDEWIEWFCFENDFGKNKHSCFHENGGKKYIISNAGELWDFLKG